MPGHVAQLASSVDLKHRPQHHSGLVFASQHSRITGRPFFCQSLLYGAKTLVDGIKIKSAQIFPYVRARGGTKARGTFSRIMAVNAAIHAANTRLGGRCKAAGHKQVERTPAETVFVQHHVAPAVHGHLLASITQIANRKPLAQQVSIAIAQVRKIWHQIIPLQANLLGQVSVKI